MQNYPGKGSENHHADSKPNQPNWPNFAVETSEAPSSCINENVAYRDASQSCQQSIVSKCMPD